nr:hypothetical protein [Tanacetum cinerariifolium]
MHGQMRKKLCGVKVGFTYPKIEKKVTQGRTLDFGLRFYSTLRAKQIHSGLERCRRVKPETKTTSIRHLFVGIKELHGVTTAQGDANLKLLRSLPSAWNNIPLIMRNKYDLDTLSMDDLYNNMKVYESEIKGQSSSRSNSQNVAFVSSDNTSSTNETVNTAHNVSAASYKDQASTASYADDVMFSFFSNQSNVSQLDNKGSKQINTDDLKEMDLKWQVAMLTMRVKRFILKTVKKLYLNGKEAVRFDRTKVECYNCHRRCHFARECRAPRNQGNRNRDAPTRNAPVDTSTTNALVVQDGIGSYDWSFQAQEELTNFALMAHTSSSSSLDSENEAVYEEDIAFLKYDVQVKDISIKDLKINKTGLGYNGLVNESEVLNNVVDSCECDGDDNQVNDRFKKSEGYHVVPSPYTGNYMPPRANLSFAGLDNSIFKYKVNNVTTVGPKEVVSAAEGNMNNVVKSSTCWIWRPKGNVIDHISKDSGSYTLKRFNYVDPQGRLKDGISDEFRVKTGSEKKLVLNVCMDWNETAAHHEIQDSAKVKTVNEDVQIRALVDEKKIIVTEASIRCDLQLQDAEGTACLPNDTIFEELARMGAKTTVWNEFSITMASAIICLANNKKFNFSKYIFDNMVKNLEAEGFSGIITPLFEIMMVQAPEEVGEGSEVPTDTHHTLIVTQPSSSQPQKKPQGGNRRRKPRMQLTELMNLCTNLQKQVLDLEKAKIAQAKEIADLKKRVKKLERIKKSRTSGLKRLWKVGSTTRVESSENKESLGDQEDASKQGRMIDNIDQDVKITLVDETQGRMNEEDMFRVNDLDGDEVIVDATSNEEVEQSTKVAEKGVQAKIDADIELAQKLQTEEQEQLTDAEKARLFMELLEKRRKFFARKRETEKRNRPPTKAQQRNLCKIIKEEKISSYHLIRADGSSKRYPSMIQMLQHIDREDLKTLWKLVKAMYGNTRLEEGYERVLWDDLKVMFEPDIESEVWRKLQGNKRTCHPYEEKRTLSLLEIKRTEVECREQELAMQEYKQRQEDIRFYMQVYDHLTKDALAYMEALRAEFKAM